MGEGEKFIRHILPGLVFLIFSALQVLAFLPQPIFTLVKGIDEFSAIFAIFATGGIGYLFSSIYFTLTYFFEYTVSHNAFINELISRKIIRLRKNGIEHTGGSVTQQESWAIISAIWYVTLKKDQMERITLPINRLSHLLHGIGITVVAILFSLIFSWCILIWNSVDLSITPAYFAAVLLTIGFLILMMWNYKNTKANYYRFVNSSVLCALRETDDVEEGKEKGLDGRLIPIDYSN